MEANVVLEALKFMMLGMGVVFSFLVVMVYALKVQAVLINKFFPVAEKPTVKKVQTNVVASNTATKVAAISAAIQHHNNLKG